jgi:hypothetical protein
MSHEIHPPRLAVAASSSHRPWIAPALTRLPPLTSLTLQSAAPVDGSVGSGGVIFSLLVGRGPSRVG